MPRERLRELVFAETSDAVLVADDRGRYLDANAAAARLTGYSREELIGLCIGDLAPDGAMPVALWSRFLGDGEQHGEFVIKRRDGALVRASFHAFANVEEGVHLSILRSLGVYEAAAGGSWGSRTSEDAALHTIADFALEALFVTDPRGRVTYVNRAAERLFGFSREDALGKHLHGLVHHVRPDGSPYPAEACPLEQAIERGESVVGREERFVHRDGSFVPVYCSTGAVLDDGGRVVATVLVVHDLTERLRHESELRARAEALEEAARERARLLAIVGHDLRTPAFAILMSAERMVRHPELPDSIRPTATRVLGSARRANRMIGDLVGYSAVTGPGGLGVQRRAIDGEQVVRAVVEELESAHPARVIEVDREGEATGDWDADRLAQVVGNLLSNAIRHGAGDAPIRVRSRVDAQRWTLEVHNDGPPIPRALLSRIFEPFVRGDVGAGAGLGLGLFVARAIVDAHGGALRVTSDEERGTTFVVELPRSSA